MHITQQMTSINLDFQVAAAALGKKSLSVGAQIH